LEALEDTKKDKTLIERLDESSKAIMMGSKKLKSLADTPEDQTSTLTIPSEELIALSKRAIENSMVAAKIKMKLKSAGDKGEEEELEWARAAVKGMRATSTPEKTLMGIFNIEIVEK
jgi:hypothetical protein